MRAASLAAELNANGFDASITPGGKGQFDVNAGDSIIFSKQREGRFPEHEEVLAALRA